MKVHVGQNIRLIAGRVKDTLERLRSDCSSNNTEIITVEDGSDGRED